MTTRTIELILEARDQASREVEDVRSSFGGLELDLRKIAKWSAAAGAAVTAMAGLAAKEAMDAEKEWTTLEHQLRNTGVSFGEVRAEIEAAGQELQDLTEFSAGDFNAALGELASMTGDFTLAMEEMGLVADLAADREMGLAEAAQIVGRLHSGDNVQRLRRWGIVVEESSEALDALRERMGGRAQQDGQNLSAIIVGLKNDFSDLVEEIGAAILRNADAAKSFRAMREAVKDAKKWVEENQDSIDDYLGKIRDLIEWVLETAKATAEWAREHRELLATVAEVAVIVAATTIILDLASAMKELSLVTMAVSASNLLGPVIKLIPAITSLKDVSVLLGWAWGGLRAIIGPAGWLLLGITAAAGAFAVFRRRTNEAKDAIDEFRGAVREMDLDSARAQLLAQAQVRTQLTRELEEARQRLMRPVGTPSFGAEGLGAQAAVNSLLKEIEQLDQQVLITARHLTDLLSGGGETPDGPPRRRRGAGGVGELQMPKVDLADSIEEGGFARAIAREQLRAREAILAGIKDDEQLGLVNLDPVAMTAGLREALAAMRAEMEQAYLDAQWFSDVVIGEIQSGLVTLAAGIGEFAVQAFDDFNSAFKGLAGLIAGILGDIMIAAGTAVVSTALAFEGLKQALEKLHPALAVGVGLALIASGAAMKAATGSFLSNPTGGGSGSFGGTGTPGGFNNAMGLNPQNEGPVFLKFEGGLWDPSDPRQMESFRRMIESLTGRRVIFSGAG